MKQKFRHQHPRHSKPPGLSATRGALATLDELSLFLREAMAYVGRAGKKKPPLTTLIRGSNGAIAEFLSKDGERSKAIRSAGYPTFPVNVTVTNGDGEEFHFRTTSLDGSGIHWPSKPTDAS